MSDDPLIPRIVRAVGKLLDALQWEHKRTDGFALKTLKEAWNFAIAIPFVALYPLPFLLILAVPVLAVWAALWAVKVFFSFPS